LAWKMYFQVQENQSDMSKLRYALLLLLLPAFTLLHAQEKFEKDHSVKNLKLKVKLMGDKIVLEAGASERYVATDLPEELKKDGLELLVDGDVGRIPANVRMIGTPLQLNCIHISKAEAAKYQLSKKKYCLKH
jgi:hypothetical protein